MLKNYFKIAVRNIFRNKIFSFINIIGLAIGLASSFVILLYVVNELSFDKYNKKLDDIYIVTTTLKGFNSTTPATPYLLGPSLKEQFPQISELARWTSFRTIVKYKDKTFIEPRCVYSDPSIFKILTLPIEEGNYTELSKNKNSVIINRKTAKTYFGNTDPVGKILTMKNGGNTYVVTIAGIMRDIPETSTFRADIIAPLSLLKATLNKTWSNVEKKPLESRHLGLVNIYTLLNPGSKTNDLEQQFKRVSENYSDQYWKSQFHLFPVKNIYFHSGYMINSRFPTGDLPNIYIYSVIGFLILLIACINIIILNTGRASTRAKEIGVRKVVGAGRFNLIKQVLMESSLYALLSLPISVLLVQIFLPVLSGLLGKELPANYFHNWQFILIFICITILVGIISGSYISVYLSKLRPIDIIRNNISIGSRKAVFRKIMVTVQMIIFIGLIIAFVIINKQMRFFHNKDFGFNKNNLIVLDTDYNDFEEKYDAFKNELKANPNILGVSGGFNIPGTEGRGSFLVPNKHNPSKMIPLEGLSIRKDFFDVMEMTILKGKSFKDLPAGELKNVCIINESAVKELSIKNPIGEFIGKQRIIGVVKDFNMHSLREKISPLAIYISTKYLYEIIARVRPTNISQTVKFILTTSKKFNNGKAMDYEFFDQRIDDLYGNEQKFDEMIGYFTGLAIFIACLGLFGMSLFVSQQRIKEIGIRKVMGASTGNIFYVLTKEFLLLTIISTIISVPIVLYFMNKWLQNFAYKIDIDISIFILSALTALLITVITVGYQAIKAATTNPVDTLRYE